MSRPFPERHRISQPAGDSPACHRFLVASAVGLLAGLFLWSAGLVGQEGEPAAVEDTVTVTAQRVEESAQDVPVSLVTFDAEELETRAVSDVQDLAEAAPGLVVSGQSSSNGEVALYIRGIGSNTFGLGTESTVGYYVDGVYIPRPQGFLNQFLDLDRIEVLRGPQGTLWGRNSTGGAINVVTRAPSADFKGRLLAQYGEYAGDDSPENHGISFSLNGALSERVFGRLSASLDQATDFTFNELSNSSVDNRDGWSTRGAVTFLPSDSVSVTVRGDLADNESHNNFNFKPGNTSPNSTLGTLLRFYGLDTPSHPHRIAANIAPVAEYEESGVSVAVDWVLGTSGTILTSTSSLREFDSRRVGDIDGTQLDFVENQGTFDSEWWSQELTLNGASDKVDWIAGAYLFHEEGSTNIDTLSDLALFEVQFFANNPGLFLFNPVDFCSLGFIAPSFLCGADYYNAIAPFVGLSVPGAKSTGNFFVTDLETDSYALFGQLAWHLNEHWSLVGGLRYTEDDKDHDQQAFDFATLMPIRQVDRDSWSGLTPKLAIEYRPHDDVMAYGSVTTGWKSGGFNSISVQPSFNEEEMTSYEVGVKSTLADGNVTLNVAAFHYDYDDLQVAVLFPDRSTVENAAEATVDGLEFDLLYRPGPRFSAELGIALLDDEFDRFTSQDPLVIAEAQDTLNAAGIFDPVALATAAALVPTSDLAGRGLPRAPDSALNAALQYRFLFGSGASVTARGEYQFTDDVAFDPFANFVQKSYDQLHANLMWVSGGSRWSVNLYGRNLTDELYVASEIFARVTGSLEVWAPPRQVGLQLGYSF